MTILPAFRASLLTAGVLLSTGGTPLLAGLIATDGNVPNFMSAGGTESDPAHYIIGDVPGYVENQTGNTLLGETTSYNSLTIQSGATLNSQTGTVGWSGNHNRVVVTGENSLWAMGGNYFNVGLQGSSNSVVIENGGTISGVHSTFIGRNAGSSNNSLTITGPNSSLVSDTYLQIGVGGGGNTVTLQDGGLLKLVQSASWALVLDAAGTDDNFLRLDGGFLAWQGDHTNAVNSMVGGVQIYKDDGWVTVGANEIAAHYFTDGALAEAFTGYSGLGGYTIFSSAAIPEPATWSLILGAAVGGVVVMRRRRPAKRSDVC